MDDNKDLEPGLPLVEPAEFKHLPLYNPPEERRGDCDRCYAKDVEAGSWMEMVNPSMAVISQERYGKTSFMLCPSCAVDYHVRSFLGK